MSGMEAQHGRRFDVDQMPPQIGEIPEEEISLRRIMDPAVRHQMDDAVRSGADHDQLVADFGEENTSAYYSNPYAEEPK